MTYRMNRGAQPICYIQHQRFTNKHSDWRLLDLCIGLAGNIAVSGGDFTTSRTFIDIYSSPPKYDVSTKPKLINSREFDPIEGYSWRYVCFLEEPNEIVTGVSNTLEVIATNENKVLRSIQVKDTIRCVSVAKKNIFIGSLSCVVYVFDKGLNFLKVIRLQGLQNDGFGGDVFEDMEVVSGRFFVCTHLSLSLSGENHKAFAFREADGKKLHTFTTEDALGVAACLEYGILCVLFSNRLEVFSLSGYHCLRVVDINSWADKVSISNRGIMVTGEHGTGEVKIYDLDSILHKTEYRNRSSDSRFSLSRGSLYSGDDELIWFPNSPRSSSSRIQHEKRWKQDPYTLSSFSKTSYPQQQRPSFLNKIKKWSGFGQPELQGAADDGPYLTSELLDDDKKSKIEVAQRNRSRQLFSSSKTLSIQQQRPSFLKSLKKWLGLGQSKLKSTCDPEDINEAICGQSQLSDEALVRYETTIEQNTDSAYKLYSLINPESNSSGDCGRSSVRQSTRYQTGEIFQSVAQEKGNSEDKAFLEDIDPSQKMTKSTKGGPTGSLESGTLDETQGPQSAAMEKNQKSDDIAEETEASPTETEVPENLEDLEKVTQISIATSAELSLDYNGYQMKDLTDFEGLITKDDQEFFSRARGIKCLEATSSISKEGGLIEIPQSGVKLYIQPNSFSRDNEVHLITVKILLRRLFDDPASCFEHHSTVMVEVLPNNLKLEREAKLILPHCLILKHPECSDVQIFHSHHDQGQNPQWENISNSVRCELTEASCSIWINNFSWIKCEIGGEYIEGKKLFVYTLGEKFTKDSNNVTAEVGYFPALPGNDRILFEAYFGDSMRGTVYESKLQEMFRGTWQLIFFRKEPRNSLMISISEIIPYGGWEASPGSACRKEISYQNIEMSIEQNWPFTFQRKQSKAPFPVVHFKVFQGDESFSTPVYVNMEKGLMKGESDVTSNDQPCALLERGDQHISKMPPVCANNNNVVEFNRTTMMLSNNSFTASQQERQFLHHQLLTWPNVAECQRNHLMACNPSFMSASLQSIPCRQPSLQIFQEFTHNEISHVAGCLDTGDPLGRDWKMLADYLKFSYCDVMNFEKQPSPTEAVIRSACQSGALTDKSELKSILHKMGRKDAATLLECQRE